MYLGSNVDFLDSLELYAEKWLHVGGSTPGLSLFPFQSWLPVPCLLPTPIQRGPLYTPVWASYPTVLGLSVEILTL